jgi:hypothetical protein
MLYKTFFFIFIALKKIKLNFNHIYQEWINAIKKYCLID